VIQYSKIPLDDEPEICTEIGRLVAHWAVVEIHLKLVMSQLLSTDQSRAVTVYNSVTSVRTKVDIMKRLVRDFIIDDEFSRELSLLFKEVERLNSKRNEIVHAAWGRHPDGYISLHPESLPGSSGKKRMKPSYPIKSDDIKKIVEEISLVSTRLSHIQVSNKIIAESSRCLISKKNN